MINARYKNVPGVCLVCGKDLIGQQTRYCSPQHSSLGQTKLTRADQAKVRAMVQMNLKTKGRPDYKHVGKALGIDFRAVHRCWKLALQERQRRHKIKCQAEVAAATADLAREIADARAHPAEEPYKPERLWLYWSAPPAP